MVGAEQRKSLEKTGYAVVGSHSAVKLCRWTKNALKGRGHCYKHSFYGIASHRCMEATPSLACANKCTFCWRSHLNPVAMRWVFEQDDPNAIVEEMLAKHEKRFVDQVIAGGVAHSDERSAEAKEVRHCALSLVGEPVLYPQVREFLEALHNKRISTFLVTNGQFPEQLEALPRVTQLYLSVDAPTERELIQVGRPLFKDAWGRLLQSLDALRAKGQSGVRTVCRLTLRKDAMSREAAKGYATLVRRAQPDFVEVKGVTPVPLFKEAGVAMSDIVPSHSEVREFGELLGEELAAAAEDQAEATYGLASEHRHSCAVLLANERLWRAPEGDGWRTWVDYPAFFESRDLPDGEGVKLAHSAPTPEWAMWNAPEAGLDPEDVLKVRARQRPDDYIDMASRPLRAPRAVEL